MTEIHECKDRPTPYPTAWAVNCPCCDTPMEYEVEEDGSGAFGFDPPNWPVCEPCGVMFQPETVEVRVVTALITDTGKHVVLDTSRDYTSWADTSEGGALITDAGRTSKDQLYYAVKKNGE